VIEKDGQRLIRAADRLPLVEIAHDNHIGLRIAGQVPHCPAEQRSALVPLLFDTVITRAALNTCRAQKHIPAGRSLNRILWLRNGLARRRCKLSASKWPFKAGQGCQNRILKFAPVCRGPHAPMCERVWGPGVLPSVFGRDRYHSLARTMLSCFRSG